MPFPVLPIHDLSARHTGLTPAIADCLIEGTRVCLDRHHHSPVEFQISWANRRARTMIAWAPTDDRTKNAWANRTDTTEAGGCACVLAAVELLDGLVAVGRAETATGADYYVALAGHTSDDFEGLIRLEVAGRDQESPTAIASVLQRKLDQAAAGNSNLPAIAGVVGFRARLISLAHLEER